MAHKNLTGDSRIALGIELLEQLTSAPDNCITCKSFMASHHLDETDVDEICQLICTLADRTSGARAIVINEDGWISLFSAAAELAPLRLSMGEGLILSYALNSLDIDDACTERLQKALLPFGMAQSEYSTRVASTAPLGVNYQLLSIAIEDGRRCRISYRSSQEKHARERVIDPLRMESTAYTSYLIAWDISKDASRRYRIDRIQEVSYIGLSCEHPLEDENLQESLRSSGTLVTVSLSADAADQLKWAGITNREDREGRAHITLAVTSPTWLFDQVLSFGGDMHIEDNRSLSEQLCSYARELILP